MRRALGIVLLLTAASASGRQTINVTPTLVQPSISGRDTFRYYCASCHGRDARGNGPVASALKTPPINLTKLTVNNGGHFPGERVKAAITEGGPKASAHGSSEMPVWGPIFQTLDPSERIAQARIEQLLSFISSVQEK